MSPRTLATFVASAIVFTVATGSAHAQTTAPEPAPPHSDSPVEITPFVASGSRISWRTGAAISFVLTSRLTVEGEVTYGEAVRVSFGDALGASANLLYSLKQSGRLLPYFTGGIGLENYGFLAEAPIGTNSGIAIPLPELALALNAGGGVKIPINEHWSIRTDARWIKGFAEPQHFRYYGGITFGAGRRSRLAAAPQR
jgi:hypothetical protein